MKRDIQHEWFINAKYGMMTHWGLYLLLAGEYGGTDESGRAIGGLILWEKAL